MISQFFLGSPLRANRRMDPAVRQRALRALLAARGKAADLMLCREVEAATHAAAASEGEYGDLVRRSCFNLTANGSLSDAGTIVSASDAVLAEGTILARIETEMTGRRERFQNMLQEKYEALDDRKYAALVRCRRCGSAEVTWDEKQTRSADEAATLFCLCVTCKNRWVIR